MIAPQRARGVAIMRFGGLSAWWVGMTPIEWPWPGSWDWKAASTQEGTDCLRNRLRRCCQYAEVLAGVLV